ncbi:MAG: hypothetical protein KatS3mg110_4607 [Pirellulaceae bacterium]|nr:MAG: hypothetical protein KatS3mg110_4607 [Pirellulaceae bacterium]
MVDDDAGKPRESLGRILTRAVRLRCPACGHERLYSGWAMRRSCPKCGLNWQREPGFYLGSIYINYGLTALLLAIVYPLLLFGGWASNQQLLAGALVFCLIFPIWFHRYARSLWLAFDVWLDPDSPRSLSPGSDERPNSREQSAGD